MNCIAALGERLLGLINRIVKSVQGVIRSTRQQVPGRLKWKHNSVEALQQRIVQFARDPRALIHARFQPDRKLPLQLLNTELIDGPKQEQKYGRTGRAEPRGLVIRWKDGEIQECTGLV